MRLFPRLAVVLGLSALVACGSTSDVEDGSSGGAGQGGSTSTGGGGSGGQGIGGDAVGGQNVGGQNVGGQGPSCFLPPACDASPPDPGPAEDWLDPLTPIVVTIQGSPHHRGRDLLLTPSDPQWVLAKFTYGLADKDLKGEKVDIYLLRDCADQWELLGSAITTQESEHASVEGVDDTGGRLYFQIPGNKTLGIGRHRLHLVVKGDLSTTEQYIEVLPADTPVFVSDIDGTLTTFETEAFTDLLTGQTPDANPSSAEALTILASKGIRPFYLTARPEWLMKQTREFLELRGYPPGIAHTTLSLVGATGNSAVTYKTDELARLMARGFVPGWVFGNTDSDATAYDNAGIQPLDHRVFFQFDDPSGGRRIDDYGELLGELGALPSICP